MSSLQNNLVWQWINYFMENEEIIFYIILFFVSQSLIFPFQIFVSYPLILSSSSNLVCIFCTTWILLILDPSFVLSDSLCLPACLSVCLCVNLSLLHFFQISPTIFLVRLYSFLFLTLTLPPTFLNFLFLSLSVANTHTHTTSLSVLLSFLLSLSIFFFVHQLLRVLCGWYIADFDDLLEHGVIARIMQVLTVCYIRQYCTFLWTSNTSINHITSHTSVKYILNVENIILIEVV